jgi:hypothetical protein
MTLEIQVLVSTFGTGTKCGGFYFEFVQQALLISSAVQQVLLISSAVQQVLLISSPVQQVLLISSAVQQVITPAGLDWTFWKGMGCKS